jgi:hypothetical protein
LPEALARSQNDFVVASPRRRPARAARGKAKPSILSTLVPRIVSAHPGRTVACAAFAAVLTGIVLNATLFQRGRHPAPLFTTAATVTPKVPAVPVPTPRPVNMASSEAVTPPAAMPSSPPAAPSTTALVPPVPVPRAAPPRPQAEPVKRDQIAALLKGGGEDASSEPSPRVAAAQRALVKVGYVLRSDGVMGATTRNAIEKFERERGLPVTGELGPRTLRELSAQSGSPIP